MALAAFLQDCQTKVEVLKQAFREPGASHIPIAVAQMLSVEERKELLQELLRESASGRAYCNPDPVDLLLSLPSEWLLANIEEPARSIVRDGDENECWQLLHNLERIDHKVVSRIAHIALQHSNAGVREAATDHLREQDGLPPLVFK